MDAALKRIKEYFFQQAQGAIWDKVKSKIEEKLGISIILSAGDLGPVSSRRQRGAEAG